MGEREAELRSRNTQGAYLLDKQRLAASVTTRSWSVMRAQSFAGERKCYIGLAQLVFASWAEPVLPA